MEDLVVDFLAAVEVGDAQTYENMTVYPLSSKEQEIPEIISMRQGFSSEVLKVSEVSEGDQSRNWRCLIAGISLY